MRPFLLACSLALLAPLSVPAAALNCGAASTPREKLVCSSKELSALDDDLSRAYAALPAKLSPSSVALIHSDQRQWLPWLDKVCPQNNPAIQAADCLKTYYTERLDQLTKGILRVNGTLFYTRADFVYLSGKLPAKGSDDALLNPGFGCGAFAWPQIDAPDADHAAFNKAVHNTAVNVESFDENKKPAGFEQGITVDGSVDAFVSVYAVDNHLVDVDLSAERYAWGGAHPGTGRYSFLWSVALQRPLGPDDVFRPGSNWQSELVEPAIAKLRQQDVAPNLWEGKELTDSVGAGIANPQQWDLSRDGLSITFAQYQVTCYACGTPRITFSWPELASYLKSGFDPLQLPDPAPDNSQ